MLDTITKYNSTSMYKLTRGQKIAKGQYGIKYLGQCLWKIHNCCICRLIIVTQTIHDIVRKGPPKMNILLSFLYLCSKGEGLWEVVCLFIRPSVYCGIIKIRGANFRALLNIYVLIIRIYVENLKSCFKKIFLLNRLDILLWVS